MSKLTRVDKILALLKGRQMTSVEIANSLSDSVANVNKTFCTMRNRGQIVRCGTRPNQNPRGGSATTLYKLGEKSNKPGPKRGFVIPVELDEWVFRNARPSNLINKEVWDTCEGSVARNGVHMNTSDDLVYFGVAETQLVLRGVRPVYVGNPTI